MDDDLYKRSVESFACEVGVSQYDCRDIRLSVTRNGYQWATIAIPKERLSDVIALLSDKGGE